MSDDTHDNLPVPLDFPQTLMLIEHSVDGEVIPQRPQDGYINATLLCKKAGRRFNDYNRLTTTKAFLDELATVTGIPVTVASSDH